MPPRVKKINDNCWRDSGATGTLHIAGRRAERCSHGEGAPDSHPTSGFVSRTTESRDTDTNTGHLLTRISSSAIHNGPQVEATRVSTDGQVNAQNEFYTHNGGVFGLKKEGDSETGSSNTSET